MILAHIAGMPVEETLLSAGPALVAAVSVGLVHIRSLRDRPTETGDPSAEDGRSELEGGSLVVELRPPAAVGGPSAASRPDEEAVP